MTEIKNAILAGLAFSILFGFVLAFQYNARFAFIAGPISGLAFGLIIYFFITSKTVKQQTQIENLDGQVIIHSGGANHFKNGEAAGGKLYLLSNRLHFKSHQFNIQNHECIIELQQIKAVNIYNTLGLIPNGLSIITLNEHKEKFVVNNRKFWKAEIERVRSKGV
jgi:hypothetical protein